MSDPSSQPPHLWVILAIALLSLLWQVLRPRSKRAVPGLSSNAPFWVGVTAWVLFGLLVRQPAGPLGWIVPTCGLIAAAVLRWMRRDLPRLLAEDAVSSSAATQNDPGEFPQRSAQVSPGGSPEAVSEGLPGFDEEDRRLFRRLVALTARRAAELMTPLSEMVCAREGQSVADLLECMRTSKVSKIPVLDKAGAHAIGVVVGKDLVPFISPAGVSESGEESTKKTARDLCRPVGTVAASRPVTHVLEALRANGAGIAAVIGPDDRVIGFVAWDQLFRVLVGKLS